MNGRTYNIYFLDWKNSSAEQRYRELCSRYPNVYRINLMDTLAETIRICARLSDLEYFWVVSSTTDYKSFQFENYSEKGLEPYLQVFGANTWLVGKQHINRVPSDIYYLSAFPDQHFITTDLKVDREPLDIVYLSNGEPYAEKHYQWLLKSVKTDNKINRIKGINGRMAAYHAAAKQSTTAWFFAVFAKLEVEPDFNWLWQPSSDSGPAHYIFHARNPVNNLEYGHMGLVVYNKALTLATEHSDLDFVMTKPHNVVPVVSGTAYYNQDPFITWRSAFRECIKLRQSNDDASINRLKIWLAVGKGNHGEWSILGAKDAVEYYRKVNGSLDRLMLSYDWQWLNEYFQKKYNLPQTQ